MRETRTYGSEGGATQTNAPFLPLLTAKEEANNLSRLKLLTAVTKCCIA